MGGAGFALGPALPTEFVPPSFIRHRVGSFQNPVTLALTQNYHKTEIWQGYDNIPLVLSPAFPARQMPLFTRLDH